jgi:hypothetical protein
LQVIERRERQLWITLGGLSLLLTVGMVLSCGWAMHITGSPVSETLAEADREMYECKHLRRAGAMAEA